MDDDTSVKRVDRDATGSTGTACSNEYVDTSVKRIDTEGGDPGTNPGNIYSPATHPGTNPGNIYSRASHMDTRGPESNPGNIYSRPTAHPGSTLAGHGNGPGKIPGYEGTDPGYEGVNPGGNVYMEMSGGGDDYLEPIPADPPSSPGLDSTPPAPSSLGPPAPSSLGPPSPGPASPGPPTVNPHSDTLNKTEIQTTRGRLGNTEGYDTLDFTGTTPTDAGYAPLRYGKVRRGVSSVMDKVGCNRKLLTGGVVVAAIIAVLLGLTIGLLVGKYGLNEKDAKSLEGDLDMTSVSPTGTRPSTGSRSSVHSPASTTLNPFIDTGQGNKLYEYECAVTVSHARQPLSINSSPILYQNEALDYPTNTTFHPLTGEFTPPNGENSDLQIYFYRLDVSTTSIGVEGGVKSSASVTWQNQYESWRMRREGGSEGDVWSVGQEVLRAGRTSGTLGVYHAGGDLWEENAASRYNGFTAFCLRDVADGGAIFHMVRDKDDSDLGKVGFHRAFVNAGDNLPVTDTTNFRDGEVTDEYPIQREGIYYFGFSIGIKPGQTAEVRLKDYEHSPARAGVLVNSTNHGRSVVSQAVMGRYYRGRGVYLELARGALAGTEGGGEISLLGFHYRPRSGIYHAWSVYSTEPDVTSGVTSEGQVVVYKGINLNEGFLYSDMTGGSTVAIPGVYYLHASSGVAAGGALTLHIRVNGDIIASTSMRTSTNPLNGVNHVSRAVSVKVKRGDVIDVYQIGRPYNGDRQSCFTGFLIYPNI